jgi:uncharacterized membrane protein YfcA
MLIADFLIIAFIFVLAVICGGLSNVTSGGVGLFSIFILTKYEGLQIQESTGTVLAASALIVLVGAISFHRKKQVAKQLVLTVGLSGVAGAFLAARWASSIQSSIIQEAFGVFALGMALYMIYSFVLERRKIQKSSVPEMAASSPTAKDSNYLTDGGRSTAEQNPKPKDAPGQGYRWEGKDPLAISVQIAIGALIGVATGIFGVGLAILGIVLFILFFKLDLKILIGTSLYASFFRYIGGSVGYLTLNLVNPFFFAVIVIGGVIGSLAGARIMLGEGKGSNIWYVKPIIIAVLLFICYEFLLKQYLPIHIPLT